MSAVGWQNTTIGAQVTLQRGMDITREQQRPGKVPVVSSGGTSSFHDTAAVAGPGVILGRKGVVGSVYYVAEDYWPHDTTLWVKEFNGNHARFVYYFFKHRARELASLDVGSANPTLNRNHVHPTPVRWPPISQQRGIAAILGALDDKIELNRRTNETLEAMARALFQSWFVDFDPVRAKMEGRQPEGMDAETAKLFPGRLCATSLGRAPHGWEPGKLGDLLARLTDGAHASPASVTVGGKPMASVKDMTPWGLTIGTCRRISEDDFMALVAMGCQPLRGDVLLAKDGARCVETVCEYQQSDDVVLLSSVAILRPRTAALGSFLHIWFSQDSTRTYLKENFVSGSAIPRVVLKDLKRAELIMPTARVVETFDRRVQAPRDLIRNNNSASASLSELRDALLPKLLSGELRIPDAERAVSAVL